MKKHYLAPETEAVYVSFEKGILFASTNGENLSGHVYGTVGEEDADDFWM